MGRGFIGSSSKARFTVAFNGDQQLIPALSNLPGVESIFGKLSQDVVGGGRPSCALADLDTTALRAAIRLAHQHGLKFYYVMNSPCMGNLEFSRATNQGINALLDLIADAGVDGVVVSMSYLLALIKRRYPKLRVSISTFVGITTSQRARMWEDQGADRLILGIDINRNRRVLEQIRRAVKCELELFANAMCLYQCPFGSAHSACNGHASSSADVLKGFSIDYHSYQCSERRLCKPSEFIRGRFIRPEDVNAYEDMGIDVLKVSDRLRSTSWIVRAASAYSGRHYDGNLADIISYPVFSGEGDQPHTNAARFLARSDHASLALLKVMQGISKCTTPVRIDNRKLDGFLDHYFQHDCENAICGVDCNYCEALASRAVSLESEKLGVCLSHIRQLKDMLEDHRTYTSDPPLVRLAIAIGRMVQSTKHRFSEVLR